MSALIKFILINNKIIFNIKDISCGEHCCKRFSGLALVKIRLKTKHNIFKLLKNVYYDERI